MKVEFNQHAAIEFVKQFLNGKIDVEFESAEHGMIDIFVTQEDTEIWLKSSIHRLDAVKIMSEIKPDYCIGTESKEYDYANFTVNEITEIIKMYQLDFLKKITDFEVNYQ